MRAKHFEKIEIARENRNNELETIKQKA